MLVPYGNEKDGIEMVEVPMVHDLGELFVHIKDERFEGGTYVLAHKRTGLRLASHARLEPILRLADLLQGVDFTSCEPSHYTFSRARTITQKWFSDLMDETDATAPQTPKRQTFWSRCLGYTRGDR